ncbi:MAG: solute:sodium symporter family transporter, partial [Pseudomonadota bacterium]
RQVPALGAKLLILFHVTACGLLRFVFDDVVTIHFLHQYAILFVIEVGIMLAVGAWRPREKAWEFTSKSKVDMTPWAFARPLAFTLFSCVVALYLLFSDIGLASGQGLQMPFALMLSALVACNLAYWFWKARTTPEAAIS